MFVLSHVLRKSLMNSTLHDDYIIYLLISSSIAPLVFINPSVISTQCWGDFLLAYLQVLGDCKLPMPGFWQCGAGRGCKVIKLMSHLNCWRMVWRVIKSWDGTINRPVFSLFVCRPKANTDTAIFFCFLSLASVSPEKKDRIAFTHTQD